MDTEFMLLDDYVKAVNELVESIELDITEDCPVTMETVTKLNNLKRAAQAVAHLLTGFESGGNGSFN